MRGDRLLRQRQRQGIAGKRLRRCAMKGARKLVQNDDFCKATQRSRASGIKFALRGLRKHGAKPFANPAIEFIVLVPPLRRLGFKEPEVDNLLIAHVAVHRNLSNPVLLKQWDSLVQPDSSAIKQWLSLRFLKTNLWIACLIH